MTLTILIEAEDDVDDLLTLWRERRRLDHQIKLALLKAELTWLSADEQEQLARDVAAFNLLAHALSERRAAA